MPQPINPPSVPASPFYSHGIRVDGPTRLLFVSGQVATRPDGSVPEGIAEQAVQANRNLQAVLADAGMSTADIVKATIYLTDRADIEPFMAAAHGLLSDPPPATTLLIQQLADPRHLVEIEATAATSTD